LHNKIVYAGADDNNFRNKIEKKENERSSRKQTIKFRFSSFQCQAEIKIKSHLPSLSNAAATHHKAVNVYSRFHLIAIQIALPFIKRTIKSSFAICDTL
jgi:hypothetical protein